MRCCLLLGRAIGIRHHVLVVTKGSAGDFFSVAVGTPAATANTSPVDLSLQIMAAGAVREPGWTRPCCRKRFKSSLSPSSRHTRSRGLGIISSKRPRAGNMEEQKQAVSWNKFVETKDYHQTTNRLAASPA